MKLSGVKGAKGEGWYGATKWATYERPMGDRFLGLDSSSIGFYVQKYLLMPIFKTRRPVAHSQIGAQRSQRSGTKCALKFKLSKVRKCWECKKKGWNEHVTAPTCFLYNQSIRLGFAYVSIKVLFPDIFLDICTTGSWGKGGSNLPTESALKFNLS